MIRFRHALAVAALLAAPVLLPASAQQGPPGTICITPQGWCPAVRPGPSGAPCACKTPSGWVQGKLN